MRPIEEIEGERGRYALLGLLASGAMGRVHLARLRDHGGAELGEVALKRVRVELAGDASIRAMFEDEARISKRLSHPNIVRTLEVGTHEGEPFMAMERVAGVTLQDLVQRLLELERALPVALVLEILGQILDALDYAHRLVDERGEPLGVVHRDVSPQNVMLSFTGELKLFDFGVGKARGKSHTTDPGLVKGKLAYMSPEQIRNVPIDARSDLFSVGILAYETLVLVHPFYGKTDATMMRAIIEQPPLAPRSVDAEFPEELEAILLRALEKDPELRFQSAREMREALERFASGRVFPPGPSIGELMQEVFPSRIRLEERARAKGDDEMWVRAARGELEEGELGGGEEVAVARAERLGRRGEELFADLPTADIDVSGLRLGEPEAHPEPEPDVLSEQAGLTHEPTTTSTRFDSLPSILPEPRSNRAIDELRFLVEATPTPLFVSRVDDGRILYANEPMAELFGREAAGIVGRPASELYVNPADRTRVVLRAKAEGTLRNFVVELQRRGGSRFWGSVSVRLAQHQGERVLIGSVLDVSHRIAIESRLARRVGHERRLAQAVAALLRTRDADPGSAGLEEALEHLRAATDADRVVLVKNEVGPDGALLMHRSHAVGVEPPSLPDRNRLPYERVPRWRTLLERGDALRGHIAGFPEAEQRLLEILGVSALLAVPIARRGRWLGFLALEATGGAHEWTDEDVGALETFAGIVAGELERRHARSKARVAGDTAALVSAGARLSVRAAEWAEAARRVAEATGHPEAVALADALDAEVRPSSSEVPEALRLEERLARVGGLELAGEARAARLAPALLERLVAEVIEELALGCAVRARLGETPAGEIELRLELPADATEVWDALDGDAAALARPGSRIGALGPLIEAMGGDVRFERGEGIAIVLELPAASMTVAEPLA